MEAAEISPVPPPPPGPDAGNESSKTATTTQSNTLAPSRAAAVFPPLGSEVVGP